MHGLNSVDSREYAADEISRVGKDFIDLLSGKAVESQRDPGLLVTNEDIRRIRRYINAGLELPTDIEHVRQLLGDQQSGIKGLEVEAVHELYQGINAHARSWAPIEADMRKVGSDLNVFAGNLITTSQHMVDFVSGLESYQQRQVGDLTPDEIDRLPPVELAPGDRRKMPALLALIDELKGYINEHGASTRRVKDGVSTFKQVLKHDLSPGVSLKIQLARSGNVDLEIARLGIEVDLLNERIDQKIAEYEEYASYRWIGWWWGPIGGAISYSIWGPKAAQALREKDELIASKRRLELKISSLNRLLSSLLTFETDMQDLKIRMDGAASSVANIESLWVLLEDLVSSSYRRFDGVSNAMFLVSFVSRFKTVIANWQDIQKQSWDLLTAFNSVLDEPVN